MENTKIKTELSGGPYDGECIYTSDAGTTLEITVGEFKGRYVEGQWVPTKQRGEPK